MTMHPLLRALADGTSTEDEVVAELARRGTPLVEPAGPGEAAVTFVHRVERDVVAVSVADVATRHHAPAVPLERVEGTRLWHATRTMPADVRASYWFEVRTSAVAEPEVAGDPWNAWRSLGDPRLDAPVLELPDAAPLRWLGAIAEDAVDARERTSEHVVPTSLGERRVWVSMPEGERPEEGWPFAVVFDGVEGHVAPLVRDRLVAEGAARPFVVVLVDQMGKRDVELTADAAFTRMLATELVPWARERCALSADAADAVVSGSSFGGLAAGAAALAHPEVFCGAILQSPSCWFQPDDVADWRAGRMGTPFRTPTIVEAFSRAARVPVRIWHECGAFEQGPPPARIAQVLGNRWLHDVLRHRGYDTVYREFAGGHDAVWWRDGWGEGMAWLLPRHRDRRPIG